MKACDARRDFHIDVTIHRYERFNTKDYSKNFQELLDASPSGVVIVPSELEVTKKFTDVLHDRDIPFILLDSYMPDLRPLSFYGQDSFSSGYFAARMLMLLAHDDKEIMLMKQTKNGQVASKQQANREVGFRHYMRDHFPSVTIHELDLPLDKSHDENEATLEAFFKKHTNVHHCVTLSARAHVVGEFLLRTRQSPRSRRVPVAYKPQKHTDYGLRYGGEERNVSSRRLHLVPNSSTRIYAGLQLY